MKVALVASPVTPLRPAQMGGAQAMVSDLASGLSRRGHDVWLYCASGSDVPGVRLVTVPSPKDASSALVMPGGPPPLPAPGVTAAIKAMFDLISGNSFDVVSQHAFDAPAFVYANDLPVLHTLHLPPLVPSVVEAAAKVGTARLATVSQASRRAWLAAGIEVGHVLPNGVEDLQVPQQPPAPYALIAGRMSPEKGLDHALAAAGRAGLRARVAGALYDPEYVVDLSTAQLLGMLTRVELRRVMADSAVTICAARWDEPFGLVAAEAQMAGCPVAAYRRGALPEVIDDGVSGALAEPDDIDSLAEAIRVCQSLDRDKVRSSALSRLGLEPALDRYETVLTMVAGWRRSR